MILGMTLSTFTLFHVVISLVGIASGLIVVYGLMTGKRFDGFAESWHSGALWRTSSLSPPRTCSSCRVWRSVGLGLSPASGEAERRVSEGRRRCLSGVSGPS